MPAAPKHKRGERIWECGIKLDKTFLGMHKKAIFLSAIILLLTGCDYARMSDQESLRPYEIALPEMPAGGIPVNGGINILREAKPEDLHNPVPRTGASGQ